MKRKIYPKLTLDDLINMWLVPFFGTTIQKVEKNWVGEKNSRAFYKKYAVTEAQHDMWYSWAIYAICKDYKWSKKMAKHQFMFTYLNCSPSIKTEI
jgi:hypothetical protein